MWEHPTGSKPSSQGAKMAQFCQHSSPGMSQLLGNQTSSYLLLKRGKVFLGEKSPWNMNLIMQMLVPYYSILHCNSIKCFYSHHTCPLIPLSSTTVTLWKEHTTSYNNNKIRTTKSPCFKQQSSHFTITAIQLLYVSLCSAYPYLPTPPLGQDMTQGQFLSGV